MLTNECGIALIMHHQKLVHEHGGTSHVSIIARVLFLPRIEEHGMKSWRFCWTVEGSYLCSPWMWGFVLYFTFCFCPPNVGWYISQIIFHRSPFSAISFWPLCSCAPLGALWGSPAHHRVCDETKRQ